MLEKIDQYLEKIFGTDPLVRAIIAIATMILLVCFLPAIMTYAGVGLLVTGLCMHIYQASNEKTGWTDVEANPKTLMLVGIVLLIVGALVNWLL